MNYLNMPFSKFRIKAFALHLLCSLCVAFLSAVLVLWVWHPFPLNKAVGVTEIFLMMLAIDAILGPLLTLTVAKENKKSLKSDLFVIACLQILALLYGLYSISVNRPAYLAFDTFRFEIVQAGDIPVQSLNKAAPPYQQLGHKQPIWVAVRPPANEQERNDRLFEELQTGVAPSMRADLYEPLDKQTNNIFQTAQKLNSLSSFNDNAQLASVLQQYPQADTWLPLKAPSQDMVVLLNSKTQEIINIVDLHPW